jgi:uracil-DNA glycosylase
MASPGASAQAPLFAGGDAAAAAPRLTGWAPAQWPVAPDWQPVLARFWASEAAQKLGAFVSARLAAGATIYPPQPLHALALTPLAEVKVVILGQDPYHGPGQAEGLAFSVAPGVRPPPSLRNIFKELAREAATDDVAAPVRPLPANGSLVRWARQGVLLLNTCLTVEDGCPASHAGQGWEALADAVLQAVLAGPNPVVFMLWGAHAQRFEGLIRQAGAVFCAASGSGRHRVLTANHPSPLSALRPPQPFLGCGHFGQANAFLRGAGSAPVQWCADF